MDEYKPPLSMAAGLRSALSHALITLLAIGIAFALPQAAQYILYYWWPQVEADAKLMLATEILLAAVLVLLFNLVVVSWNNRRFVESAKLASLVHARKGRGGGWLVRLRQRRMLRRLPASRDAFVLTVTGFHTFVEQPSLAASAFNTAYEIRVMLLNPASGGARQRISSLPVEIGLSAFSDEIEASIGRLEALRKAGKKVTLKFYDDAPFWKVVVLGEHVWVQYCHDGHELRHATEYVFALNSQEPGHGLFVPFYMLFLRKWSEPQHPEYDFDTRQLVFRDALGKEVRREPFVLRPADDPEKPGFTPVNPPNSIATTASVPRRAARIRQG